jgi:deazaflavin-dependent oxidoreductase (nitroreductase family)
MARASSLLVASVRGAPKSPTWYGYLVKHRDFEVRHRRRSMQVRARLATEAEKPALWSICDSAYPLYADYRSRTSRSIPIFVCEPLGQISD